MDSLACLVLAPCRWFASLRVYANTAFGAALDSSRGNVGFLCDTGRAVFGMAPNGSDSLVSSSMVVDGNRNVSIPPSPGQIRGAGRSGGCALDRRPVASGSPIGTGNRGRLLLWRSSRHRNRSCGCGVGRSGTADCQPDHPPAGAFRKARLVCRPLGLPMVCRTCRR
jgi:hypothetical protein